MKIALITGASSGMGREFARQIDSCYKLDEIWLIARRKEALSDTAAALSLPVCILPLDLEKETDLEELKKQLKWKKPFIKVLVNAAGFGKIGRVGDISFQDAGDMVTVNAKALTQVTHLCLPYCGNKSRILQMGSASAFIPQPKFAVYAATKAYVLSFSRALAREEKRRGITVTCICPGPVRTPFFYRAGSPAKVPLLKKLVMADPEKVVAKAIKDGALGRELSVYGWSMKLVFILCRIIPHKWILPLMGFFL